MNTRLQVEHPVTEAITGFDLVEWQLRVASGEKLPATQKDIHAKGHAVEARLYAEDPDKGFLPSVGKLERLHFPQGVRIDTGVREGDTVSPFYDPMIAKVIAWDETREGAIAKLADALAHTQVAGVHTNNAFLIRALRHPDFIAGNIDTGFIARHEAALLPHAAMPEEVLDAAAAQVMREFAQSEDPWSAQDGFRLSGKPDQTTSFVVDGKRVSVSLPPRHTNAHTLRLANGDIAVMENGETWTVKPYDPFEAADTSGASSDRVIAPMPGKVIQLLARAGEKVKKGQPLAVLEAMKMEHTLAAPADATVDTVDVSQGDQVNEGAIIVRFAAKKSAA
jgi:3-methylcrotonyl-CoA carboxylase alpha subunit